MKALILAGGSGTRLWPLSRNNNPKQFLSLYKQKSLLRHTFERLQGSFDNKNIWLAAASEHQKLCQIEIPAIKNYSLEPIGANTAPAIGLALLHIKQNNSPQSIVVTVNSDHYIADKKEYLRIIKQAEKIVKQQPDKIVLVGVQTDYPETGYGYIKIGSLVKKIGKDKIYKVANFVEKPNLAKAKKYHQSGKYLWNPAIFIFSVQTMWKLFEKYLPSHYKILQQMEKIYPNQEKIFFLFKKFTKISIDYGILEKAYKDLLVIPASFGWSDIGSWQSVSELFVRQNNNQVNGKFVSIDSKNNIIYAPEGKLVTTIGVKDSLIVFTSDAVLVADKNRTQEVKKIVEILQQKDKKFL